MSNPMSAHSWWTFVIAIFFICGSPGPNMLMMMSSSVKHGMRRTFFTMAGCYLALLLMLAISAAGLGTLLKIEPVIFNILRYMGAAYLIYLGIKAWRAPAAGTFDSAPLPAMPATSPKKMFRNGFLVGISNPKALVFASAFYPQFINQDAPVLPQFAILLVTFSIMEFSWYVIYASGGRKLTAYMKQANVQKAFNRFTGGLFVVFGALLLSSRLD